MNVSRVARLLASAAVLAVGVVGIGVAGGAAPAQAGTVTLAASSTVLRPGDSGAAVKSLQTKLVALGYWLGSVDGEYGPLTKQAVVAAQKAAGLTRDGIAGPKTMAALADKVRPSARSTKGLVVEVNLSKQLLLVVKDGRVLRIINTSTGTGKTYTRPNGTTGRAVTPKGTFRVNRQIDGWRTSALGKLYRPKYFTTTGVAVHGATSVPAYPASHGCVRVSLKAMAHLWSKGYLPIGGKVYVY